MKAEIQILNGIQSLILFVIHTTAKGFWVDRVGLIKEWFDLYFYFELESATYVILSLHSIFFLKTWTSNPHSEDGFILLEWRFQDKSSVLRTHLLFVYVTVAFQLIFLNHNVKLLLLELEEVFQGAQNISEYIPFEGRPWIMLQSSQGEEFKRVDKK